MIKSAISGLIAAVIVEEIEFGGFIRFARIAAIFNSESGFVGLIEGLRNGQLCSSLS